MVNGYYSGLYGFEWFFCVFGSKREEALKKGGNWFFYFEDMLE